WPPPEVRPTSAAGRVLIPTIRPVHKTTLHQRPADVPPRHPPCRRVDEQSPPPASSTGEVFAIPAGHRTNAANPKYRHQESSGHPCPRALHGCSTNRARPVGGKRGD